MPWFWRKKRTKAQALAVKPKGEGRATSKVDVGSLAPPAADYVAGACVLHLAMASELSSVAHKAWSAEDADALMMASGIAMDRYRALRALLEDYESDIPQALAVPRDTLARHLERFSTTRWYEQVGTVYVLTGFSRDFWSALAEGLPEGTRDRVLDIIADAGDEDLLAGVLERVLGVDQRYLSRLSLWSRRLVGDIMLICKDALSSAALGAPDTDIRLEPVFTDVLPGHTARLDRLGLTA